MSISHRVAVALTLLVSLGLPAFAQTKASIDVSDTLFSVVSAMNVCGYDQELSSSSPIRMQVRADLVEASKLPHAAAAANEMCRFYQDHRQGDATHDLAQYVSLALNLGPAPGFEPKLKEADLPPDAAYVLGFVPVLKQYYAAAGLHSIWLKHQAQYDALIDQFHDPVSRMINATDTYLRMPMSGYSGRSFTVYFEPMAAPGQVNSRNYLQDTYYLVVSPTGDNIHMDALRHTYLHFVLDPLIAKRATALNRLAPVLLSVQTAPMEVDYKRDMGLLVLECLIRAIEARNPMDSKLPEKDRSALVQRDEAEGFVLTGYFYDQLRQFEKAGIGLQDAFPNWLHDIDVQQQKKRASQIAYAPAATPDVMQSSQRASQKRIDMAEQALASGNPAEAEKLAQASLRRTKIRRGRTSSWRKSPASKATWRARRPTSRRRRIRARTRMWPPGVIFTWDVFTISRESAMTLSRNIRRLSPSQMPRLTPRALRTKACNRLTRHPSPMKKIDRMRLRRRMKGR